MERQAGPRPPGAGGRRTPDGWAAGWARASLDGTLGPGPLPQQRPPGPRETAAPGVQGLRVWEPRAGPGFRVCGRVGAPGLRTADSESGRRGRGGAPGRGGSQRGDLEGGPGLSPRTPAPTPTPTPTRTHSPGARAASPLDARDCGGGPGSQHCPPPARRKSGRDTSLPAARTTCARPPPTPGRRGLGVPPGRWGSCRHLHGARARGRRDAGRPGVLGDEET